MVHFVPVGMQIALKRFQKRLRMRGGTAGLIFIQNDGALRIAGGSVQPHITFRLRFFTRFTQNLQRRFIRVKDFGGYQLPLQLVINRLQPILGGFHKPVRHRLPRQKDTITFELLLLPIQRHAHYKLLRHDMGDRLRRGETAFNDRRAHCHLHNRDGATVLLAIAASIDMPHMLPDFDLRGDDYKLPPGIAHLSGIRIRSGGIEIEIAGDYPVEKLVVLLTRLVKP